MTEDVTQEEAVDSIAPTVPRQSRGRHDAYDIYAQIYALRIEATDSDTATGSSAADITA